MRLLKTTGASGSASSGPPTGTGTTSARPRPPSRGVGRAGLRAGHPPSPTPRRSPPAIPYARRSAARRVSLRWSSHTGRMTDPTRIRWRARFPHHAQGSAVIDVFSRVGETAPPSRGRTRCTATATRGRSRSRRCATRWTGTAGTVMNIPGSAGNRRTSVFAK